MNSLVERLLTFLGVRYKRKAGGGVSSDIVQRVQDELLARSELYRMLRDSSYRHVLAGMFDTFVQKKSDLIDLVDAYKDTFFHQMIVNLLIDDVLNVDPLTNDIVDLSSDDDNIRRVLDELQERIDLDSFIAGICEDVISYGDYVVKVVVSERDRKVVELEEDIDQRKVLVWYKGGVPVFAVDMEGVKEYKEEAIKEPIEFIHFCVGPRKLKLKVGPGPFAYYKGGSEYRFSEYVRLGKPLLWGCWDLVNSLYVLTVFYPVFAVNKLNASTIVGIKVPPDTPPARAADIARHYQELLNVSVGVDRWGRIAVADVIDTVGRYKVVPVWGDEKGLFQLNDPRLEESFALDILADLRRTVCASLGIPHSFLFGGTEEGASKLEALRVFTRYVKRVASIQRAIREGLTQLALIECRLRGIYARPEQIEVRFRNTLVSVENLDKLEFITTMIEAVRGAVDTVSELSQTLQASLDREKVLEFLNAYLGMVGLDGVLKLEEKEIQMKPEVENEFENLVVEEEEFPSVVDEEEVEVEEEGLE